MNTQGNKRFVGQRNHEPDDGSIEIGAEFVGLTLIRKDGCDWLFRCACKKEVTIKRIEIMKNKRISCGIKCKKRAALRRKSKEKNAIQEASVHMEIPGFKKVETRKHPSGSMWLIFRRA